VIGEEKVELKREEAWKESICVRQATISLVGDAGLGFARLRVYYSHRSALEHTDGLIETE
jgi:hypothetical protein